MKLSKIILALIVVATLGTAKGQELVVNGGFETGDFTGWTTQDSANGTHFFVDTDTPNSGSYDAHFGNAGGQLDYITQNLATTIGETYQLSFYLNNQGDPSNEFYGNIGGTLSGTWDGTSLTAGGAEDFLSGGGTTFIDLANVNATFSYSQYTTSFTATSTSTPLTFGAWHVPSHFFLDDISVIVAPEPSTWVLLLGGLGLLAFWRVRSHKA